MVVSTTNSDVERPHHAGEDDDDDDEAKPAKRWFSCSSWKYFSMFHGVVLLWLLALSIGLVWLTLCLPPNVAPGAREAPAMPIAPGAAAASGWHEYAFNIYDTSQLTFPPPNAGTTGIPHLHWHRIQAFHVCCRFAPPSVHERLDCSILAVLDQQALGNDTLQHDAPTAGRVVLKPTARVLPWLTGARCVLFWRLTAAS